MYNVKLIYFKESGKYYSSGSYETNCEHMFEIFAEVKDKVHNGELPGLMKGSKHYHVLIADSNHPQFYPGLIPLTKE